MIGVQVSLYGDPGKVAPCSHFFWVLQFWAQGWGVEDDSCSGCRSVALGLETAPKPYMMWSLGPKALKYESLEP